jgi:hypothetical protein
MENQYRRNSTIRKIGRYLFKKWKSALGIDKYISLATYTAVNICRQLHVKALRDLLNNLLGFFW